MKVPKKIKQLFKNSNVTVSSDFNDKVLFDAGNKLTRTEATPSVSMWRTIMKSPITKLAATAVIILSVVLSTALLDKTTSSVYGIQQTITASHSVSFLHIRVITPLHEDEPVEAWLEFRPDGQPQNMRLNLPDWMAPGGGPRVVIWKDNKKQEWLKDKNIFTTIDDESSARQVLNMVESLDPRLAVKNLQEKQKRGIVTIDINEPSDKSEPIAVTATFIKGDNISFEREVLFIDQATKLVNAIELYKLKNGSYEYVKTLEYHDYNQIIDEKMFTFEEMPDDVEHIDTSQPLGLEQGDLKKEEIALKIVQEFLEALIAKDYAKAGSLHGVLSVAESEKMFSTIHAVRIVSIGEPTPDDADGIRVPITIETEQDGEINQVQDILFVCPADYQSGYWVIH